MVTMVVTVCASEHFCDNDDDDDYGVPDVISDDINFDPSHRQFDHLRARPLYVGCVMMLLLALLLL